MDEDLEKNRGRIEYRKCEIIRNLEFLDKREEWKGLKGIIKITSNREIGDKKTSEIRWYITSFDSSAKQINQYIILGYREFIAMDIRYDFQWR